jgi:ABC-type uncharacterized transport system permease subunit
LMIISVEESTFSSIIRFHGVWVWWGIHLKYNQYFYIKTKIILNSPALNNCTSRWRNRSAHILSCVSRTNKKKEYMYRWLSVLTYMCISL